MKRALIPVILVVVVGIAVWFGLRGRERTAESEPSRTNPDVRIATADVTTVQQPSAPADAPPGSNLLIGEMLLEGYADPSQPPERDLTLMSRLIDNFLLLVKNATDRPLSANEEWGSAFRGANPAQQRFLPDDHIALNEQGQVVDRWGTPLFFHSVGEKRFEIRSAGPDQELWTDDDIHLADDGSFLRGDQLGETSLFSTDRPQR